MMKLITFLWQILTKDSSITISQGLLDELNKAFKYLYDLSLTYFQYDFFQFFHSSHALLFIVLSWNTPCALILVSFSSCYPSHVEPTASFCLPLQNLSILYICLALWSVPKSPQSTGNSLKCSSTYHLSHLFAIYHHFLSWDITVLLCSIIIYILHCFITFKVFMLYFLHWTIISLKLRPDLYSFFKPFIVCVCVCVRARVCARVLSCFSRVWLFATLWMVTRQASLNGIPQARILEWVAMPSSRGSSWPRDWTHTSHDSCISDGIFTEPQ